MQPSLDEPLALQLALDEPKPTPLQVGRIELTKTLVVNASGGSSFGSSMKLLPLSDRRRVLQLRDAASRALRWFRAKADGTLSSLSDHEDLLIARELAEALKDLRESEGDANPQEAKASA